MLEIKFDYIMFPSDVRCTEQEFISAHLCTALHGNISKTHSIYGYLFDPKGTKGQKNCVAWGVWQNFLAVVILTSLPQLAWDKRLCYCCCCCDRRRRRRLIADRALQVDTSSL